MVHGYSSKYGVFISRQWYLVKIYHGILCKFATDLGKLDALSLSLQFACTVKNFLLYCALSKF